MSRNLPVTKLAVVDIETLDKTPSAVIFAIGCVVVDIEQLEIVNEFYTVVNPKQKGRTAGSGTPEWWLKQSLEAPEAFEQLQAAYSAKKTLKAGLYELGSFLNNEFDGSPVNMFGNGPEFDNVILNDAFAWAGLKTPWPYWGNQSIRTSNLLLQIAGVKVEREFAGIKHHALDDACHEARLLIDALKLFKPAAMSFIPSIDLGVKSASERVEQAVKKLNNAFGKGINIENDQQKESSDPYVGAVRSIYGALDSMGEEWRKPNQETRQSAVEKVREMAALINAFDMGELQESHKNMEAIKSQLQSDGFEINKTTLDKIKQMALTIDMCDLERVSGEYQAAHRYMTAIKTKLRGHGYEPNSFNQIAGCIDNVLFENQSLKERAHCFDELQKLLRSIEEESFEREIASSLLDDCNHAINKLVEYRSKYTALKIKHQHCD